jgi:hypothetical protein
VPTFVGLELVDHGLDFAHGPVHDGVEVRRGRQVVDLESAWNDGQLVDTLVAVACADSIKNLLRL